MKISILMVNYNTEQFIANFLQDLSIQTLTIDNYEIIITNNVQNNILKDILDDLNLSQKLNIVIIQSEQNIGFGRAMNLASEHAQGQHILIANPDLRMMQTDYLEKLLAQAQIHTYGIITTQLINDLNERPLVKGKKYKKNKIDVWTYFYYDQKVKINIKYIDIINVEEQYLNLDGTPFSGEFEYVDVEKNKKEIRKIKDGLRNGKTTIIDLETNKTISKESYKDGQLKE